MNRIFSFFLLMTSLIVSFPVLAGSLSTILGVSGSGSSGGGPYKGHQLITTSGNWTVPAGVTKVDVIVIGGGTGGQGSGSMANFGNSTGGSGGSSGLIKIYLQLAVTPGSNVAVTVGAGGAGGANNSLLSSGSAGTASCFGTSCSTGGVGSSGASGAWTNCAGTANGGGTGTMCLPTAKCQISASTMTNISVTFPSTGMASAPGYSNSCGNNEWANGGPGGVGFTFPFNDLDTTTAFGAGGSGGTSTCGCVGNTNYPGGAGANGVVYVRW